MRQIGLVITFHNTNPNITLENYDITINAITFDVARKCIKFVLENSNIKTTATGFEFRTANILPKEFDVEKFTVNSLVNCTKLAIREFKIQVMPKSDLIYGIGNGLDTWVMDKIEFIDDKGNSFPMPLDTLEYINNMLVYVKGCSSCTRNNCLNCISYNNWEQGKFEAQIPKCKLIYKVTPETCKIIQSTIQYLESLTWNIHSNLTDIQDMQDIYRELQKVTDVINLNTNTFLNNCPSNVIDPEFDCQNICTSFTNNEKGLEYQLECWRRALHLETLVFKEK